MIGIDDAIDEGLKLINKFIPDREAQAQAENEFRLALANIEAQQAQAQSDVNKTEASNENLFVSGWRPFIGWICGISLGYHFVLQPLLAFTLSAFHNPVILPDFDNSTLSTILMGMLGLGAMRTVEKIKQ
jgi:hypothetical protein